MIVLDEKFVFHVPLYKYKNGSLIAIEIDEILDELLFEFESYYISKIESCYKSRKYEELLITVFSKNCSCSEIFKDWFLKNNDVLCQEAFAYEYNGKLFVEEL